MKDFLCTYVKNNNLHNISEQLILKGELFYIIIAILSSIFVIWFLYKLKNDLSPKQHEGVQTVTTFFGFEPTIFVPVFSFILVVIIVWTGCLESFISECGFVKNKPFSGFHKIFITYPSLIGCLFLLINPIISLLLAICDFCKKKNAFGKIGLVIAIIQSLIFWISLPDNTEKKIEKPKYIFNQSIQ